ncbi:kinase-like domain-containing protein [Suillus americanus]|nr:kinase-like domain-containing protein [Suillus americanus]
MQRKRDSSQAFPPDTLCSSAKQCRRRLYNTEHAIQPIHTQTGGFSDDASSAEEEEMRVKAYRYNDPSNRGIQQTSDPSDRLGGGLAYIHTLSPAGQTRVVLRGRAAKQPWSQSARPTLKFRTSPGFGAPSMVDQRSPNPVVLHEQPSTMSTARQAAFPHPDAAAASQQMGAALTSGTLAHQISPLVVPNVTPSTQVVPTILIPDLTGLITRCSPDPVCGGTYGNIYKCIYHGPNGDENVAVKAIRPQFTSDQMFRRELGIWRRLRHSSILRFMGTTSDFGPSVALVAPWIANDTLTSFLKQNSNILTLLDRMCLIRDISAGLNYLHTFSLTEDGYPECNPVVHGDLTGTNVLVDGDRKAYLADFGLSGTLTQQTGMTYLAKLSCHPGAVRWTAPELLAWDEPASAVTTRSDVYSFGNIFLQVLTGDVPWPHLTRETAILRKVIFERELHPRPDDGCVADKFWNFMTRCWSIIPTDRPSAAEALQFVDYELSFLRLNGCLFTDTSACDDRRLSPCSSRPDSPSLPSARSGAPSPSPSHSYPNAYTEYFPGAPPQDRSANSNQWSSRVDSCSCL